jgi:hypothetical protein
MGMPVEPVWEQEAFAFYQDGTESGSTLIGSANAQQTLTVNTIYQLRVVVADTQPGTATASDPTLEVRWQYNHASGGWFHISDTTPLQFANSGNTTDGGATSNRTDVSGTGTFTAGNIFESHDGATAQLTANGSTQHTELLLIFQIDGTQVTHGDEILVRIVEDGGALLTYDQTPDIDVNKPPPSAIPRSVSKFVHLLGGRRYA